jgi:hypothetical protein
MRRSDQGGHTDFTTTRIFHGEQKANMRHSTPDEGRKRVLLIAASILAARKLASYDPPARVPRHRTAPAIAQIVG